MRVLNKTLIALAISASLITACSKDDGTGLTVKASDIEHVDGDNSRFVSYNTIAIPEVKCSTRAEVSTPEAPAVPEGAVSMLDVDGQGNAHAYWRAKADTNYYLPEGAVCTEQLKLTGSTNYYIAGELKLNIAGVKGEIYILPGGKLTISGKPSINNVTIKCWGELDVDSDATIIIGKTASLISYSIAKIEAASMQNQGEFEHHGDITLSANLDCSGPGSSFTLYGDVAAKSMKVQNTGAADVKGNVVAETSVEVNGVSSLKVGAALVIEDEAGSLYVTNNSSLDVIDYIKCHTLKLDYMGAVIIHNETLVVCENLKYGNNTAKIHNADEEAGVCAVIVVKNLEEAWNSIDRMNGGGIDLHTDPEEYEGLEWTANVIFNGSTYIPEKGLRPEFGEKPSDPAPVYTLNHIGSIESVDRENVSATSIDFIDDLAYFSWHKRGDEYDGYIDVADIEERSILSTLHSATQDFNNISVFGDQISAVGADADGAIVSNINYENSAVTADYSHIEGASANSVLNVGDNTWVTTNRAITILPENKVIALESAKYAVAAGDKVVVLAGTPDASLYVFEQSGELVKSFECGTIAIENGKNTIFADGDTIYVSLGVGGMRAYDLEGNMLNEFTAFENVAAGAVNGVSADEDYIYMACGLSGLYILDRSDFSLVKSYTLNGASANFVKRADDGKIYVAYGLNGIHVLELLVKE